jgi:death-associated protein kinase
LAPFMSILIQVSVHLQCHSLTFQSLHDNRISASIIRSIESRLEQRRLMSELGAAPLVQPRLFVCGREHAGKTSLVSALQRGLLSSASLVTDEERLPDRSEKAVKDRTRGVAVSVLELSGDTRFSVWDFAGQLQYYVTHELFLAAESAIFVIVCRLSEEKSKREADLEYWMRFIATRFPPEVRS